MTTAADHPRETAARAAAPKAAGLAWNDAVGPFFDIEGVRTVLGGPSRQAIADGVRGLRLLALRTADVGKATRLLYPVWQFDGEVLRVLPDVLRAVGYDADDAVHGWCVASWLSAPDPRLGDRRPCDLLAAGHADLVVTLAEEVRHEMGVGELTAARAAIVRR